MAASLAKSSSLTLFGGEEGWNSDDDSVRGGKSESFLECKQHYARFYGPLDIETLGGAGFASQRTTGDDREWDLSKYKGISIDIKSGDKKRYTFILKDELLSRDETTGRERSTISWECDFELPPQTEPGETHERSVFIPWESLNPTYRGKLKKDADPLDTEKIKRISIMMRSFFGAQEGAFELKIKQISALSKIPGPSAVASDSPSMPSISAKKAKATSIDDWARLEAGADPRRRAGTKVPRQLVTGLLGAAALFWLGYRCVLLIGR